MTDKQPDWPMLLRAFRKKHDLMQKELAQKLKTKLRNIENWEQGKSTPPPYLKAALETIAKRRGKA